MVPAIFTAVRFSAPLIHVLDHATGVSAKVVSVRVSFFAQRARLLIT
jgi:hypothetical protein